MPLGTTTELGSVPEFRSPTAVRPVVALRTVAEAEPATCVCGHAQAAHEHYRPGSDCALCDCPKYRRAR